MTNFREADRIQSEWELLARRAEALEKELPAGSRDAYFELVLHPVEASAIVNKLYIMVAKNRLYASQGRASTNDLAEQARALYQADADLSARYNHDVAGGKWNHMMDQTHIGYTGWHDPDTNTMPEVKELRLLSAAQMGVAIDGSTLSWPGASTEPALPTLDAFNQQRTFLDIFNRGSARFELTLRANHPWLKVSELRGRVEKETRVWVNVDWSVAPKGVSTGTITVSGNAGPGVSVNVNAFNPESPARESITGFVESRGFVSIESAHYAANVSAGPTRWEEIPDLAPRYLE